ncbi:tRNA (adenosine(37)-N6)-dimethylallyltransferase MiaA [Sphingomonas oligophenolica]|uniref:tRNA dimethylallyltransferase n=1 Tax=Sphingomonas oligophenolica TaxID=301154 RepID=A0A502CJ39_9SPHN|nr:tRNA (adenosine(37)-N6)-dimethylallyltransferase MiaA [Sphingomonas oligophenolica]TPG12644.1 tRNA (adenosine(37)-N6)-dimethylallyltransferase MiaA [Sphingomonas oligophenolica]
MNTASSKPDAKPGLALIAGPTASGKSALAIRLAERHGGVIVNADASQVYADLRILTARPSAADEARVPHRLFGDVDAAETGYSAACWAAEAKAAIAAVHAAGQLPILVGGTGLYLRTLIDGIAPVPAIDPAIRTAVRALPVADAHAALKREDPPAAARLAAADTTRVARALEVVRSTGRALADWHLKLSGGIGDSVTLTAAILLPDRFPLFDRIDARTDAMLAGGALDEVAALLARDDVPPSAAIRRAIGVPALAAYLAGDTTLAKARDRIALDTRRYAKRQYTWFRNQPPEDWTILTESDDISAYFVTKLR